MAPPFLLLLLLLFHLSSSAAVSAAPCATLHHHSSAHTKCTFLKTHPNCHPKGYLNYLQFFYCNLSNFPQLGFLLLLLLLLILFYILSNTAAEYFCPAVQRLSKILALSPAIAGTTLLPLGNGSTDVFASFISFTAAAGDGGDIGLNSILGGSIFISTVVVGILSLLISSRAKIVVIDRPNFVRDVVFLLFSLSNLLVIVLIGKISFWVSLIFASTYVIYIGLVSYMHFISVKKQGMSVDDEQSTTIPLLICIDDDHEEKVVNCPRKTVPKRKKIIFMLLNVMNLPFYLPRRLTIPLASQEKWSKPFAVVSMVLAPVMLAIVWNTQEEKMGSRVSLVIYLVAGLIGVASGTCTFVLTSSSLAPQKCVLFWYASGFVMSVTWTYITAEELVSLLESLGTIVGLNPSILGLTVLAWGNSVGDLTANVAMAMHDGTHGAQIAISGCYAGPLFNILVGLGFSFVFASWLSYPDPYRFPVDPYLCETVGFLMSGLLWALVILPKRDMRIDRTLGGGLLVIYSCFLFIKLARVLGWLSVSDSNSIVNVNT